MLKHLRNSTLMIAAFTVICGAVYPLLVTMIASVAAPYQRSGSMVVTNERIAGSEFVGQLWSSARYFHGRPSAIAYQPLPSGGTNRTVAATAFRGDLERRRDSLAVLNEVPKSDVPSDLVMASASGIDPHISPEAAQIQVARVMKARGMSSSQRAEVERLIMASTEHPLLGLFGTVRVNVLRLNIAMDALQQ